MAKKATPSGEAPADSMIMRSGYRSDAEWIQTIRDALAAGRRVRAIDGAGKDVDAQAVIAGA